MSGLVIRQSGPADGSALTALYPAAFPEENLLCVVAALLEPGQPALSLVAVRDGAVAGHVIFTACEIEGSDDGDNKIALLAPLAVAPAHQWKGIGRALVEAGMERLRDTQIAVVCVLGDPGYYGRLGFAPETAIAPPYPLPAAWRDAWQSRTLIDKAQAPRGRLLVPFPWQDPALWGP